MIDRFRTYWTGRSPREQRLLAIMFTLLGGIILWFGLVAPLMNARREAQVRLAGATIVSGRVSARADALRRENSVVPVPLGASLAAAVAASAAEAGFVPSRMDPQGDDRLVLAISSARSPALFTWLDALARKGIFVEKVMVRPNGDATVSCEATLRLRRK